MLYRSVEAHRIVFWIMAGSGWGYSLSLSRSDSFLDDSSNYIALEALNDSEELIPISYDILMIVCRREHLCGGKQWPWMYLISLRTSLT